jgi:hypothetical protein
VRGNDAWRAIPVYGADLADRDGSVPFHDEERYAFLCEVVVKQLRNDRPKSSPTRFLCRGRSLLEIQHDAHALLARVVLRAKVGEEGRSHDIQGR